MGLASASWEVSCRTWGGTSGGTEVAIPISYGYIRRKIKVKHWAFQKGAILVRCTPVSFFI